MALHFAPDRCAVLSRPLPLLAAVIIAALAVRCKYALSALLWGVRSIGRFLAGFSRFQEPAARWALRLSLAAMFVVGWALIVLALAQVAHGQTPRTWPSPSAAGQQCENGQCPPIQSRGIGVGLSVGGWRMVTPRVSRPAVPASPVVPVLFGTDPVPGAGVYVGVIGGHGVTLTCWHAAKHGVVSVASERPTEITRDRYSYDMAAVLTRPLNAPVARLGQPPRPGEVVTIVGFPGGRHGSHTGRVRGYAVAESGQPWGDLMINVSSQDGHSGGGVFGGGQLVGLLWGTHSDGSAGSMAVPVQAIADFLERIRLRDEAPLVPVPETWDSLEPAPPPADTDLAELRAELAELRKLIEGIESHGRPGERGPAGERGEPGPAGPPGADGTSPTFDYAAIPLTFQIQDADGNVMRDADGKLMEFSAGPDGIVPLRAMTFQLLDSGGDVIQEYTAGLGGIVPFQLVPVGD